jgi:hypothetical protein
VVTDHVMVGRYLDRAGTPLLVVGIISDICITRLLHHAPRPCAALRGGELGS